MLTQEVPLELPEEDVDASQNWKATTIADLKVLLPARTTACRMIGQIFCSWLSNAGLAMRAQFATAARERNERENAHRGYIKSRPHPLEAAASSNDRLTDALLDTQRPTTF